MLRGAVNTVSARLYPVATGTCVGSISKVCFLHLSLFSPLCHSECSLLKPPTHTGLEDSLDWFNFMSYDIHGVWDSTNKFTGPFILPHTNLTEIKLGLDLLWRNGIDPGYVTLGLGWYGRSFTLSDPSCSTPNGVCQFSSGGKPGPCTNSAGTLSNAEIFQVLAQTGAKPSFDSTAAVKWITWDTNQWVSYDDGQTMKLKIDAANNLCIGGVMIWSVDQDDTNGTSTSDLLGLGTANGISSAKALELKQNQRYAVSQATNMNSCYWTFCGDSCASGYFPQTSSNGQVNGVSSNTVCKNGQLETLCCASGTNMGTCEWEGWNGVGMSCSGGGCLGSGSVAIAFNTNNYIKQAAVGLLKDQTCHGGFQSYCCLGFRASPKGSISSLDLVGLNGKDTNPGLNVGKFAGLTVACTAAATAAGTAAGTYLRFYFYQGLCLVADNTIVSPSLKVLPLQSSLLASPSSPSSLPPLPLSSQPAKSRQSRPLHCKLLVLWRAYAREAAGSRILCLVHLPISLRFHQSNQRLRNWVSG